MLYSGSAGLQIRPTRQSIAAAALRHTLHATQRETDMHNGTTRVINALAAGLVFAGTFALAQAPLDPPGPPAPTMHSLDEIFVRTEDAANLAGAAAHHASIAESRTPISEAPFVINESGSYVVTENLVVTNLGVHGIEVNAYHVTLDLNGFMLKGPGAGSGSGIHQPAQYENLVVRNGTVLEWKGLSEYGINAAGEGNRIEKVTALHNSTGVAAGPNGAVVECTVLTNSVTGIDGGVACAVRECTVKGSTTGINVKSGLIAGCVSAYNNWGISADSNATIRGCESLRGGFEGITVGDNCLVTDNATGRLTDRSEGSGSACIRVTGSNNRIVNNHCTGADNGLEIDGRDNYVAGNTVRDNNDNYEIADSNKVNVLLCELPESIEWPSTVTFAGSLNGAPAAHGISILADNVTIDLSGHSLIGSTNSWDGITAGSRKHIAIKNGTVRGFSGSGIYLANADRCVLTDVRCVENGSMGIALGNDATLTGCLVITNGATGIKTGEDAQIHQCTSSGNSGTGIETGGKSLVTECKASDNSSHGLHCAYSSTIRDCISTDNGTYGVLIELRGRVLGTTANENGSHGITMHGQNVIRNCTAIGNDGAGIRATGSVVTDNYCRLNVGGGIVIHASYTIAERNVTGGDWQFGIRCDDNGNYVGSNRSAGSATNFHIGAGNVTGSGGNANIEY